ncbi:DNA replication/repair protein RecF [Henriciella sp.]|uniref:DNA replication/repair protein RecF n=1 Tax=Henriciella sp. TaxID=1968823 RepID=UPI00260AD5EB|nr:DNA replication/repair protein RecF [Henriciella sp.]
MTALTRLRLKDFRNYETLGLDLDGRHVCLYGPNGAGKTNLLEAVSQLGPGRGLRSATLADLTRHGAGTGWTVGATIDDRRIGVGLETDGTTSKRVVRIDGAPSQASDLAELVRIVWLTPAMDGVFRGGASDRRRFFDRQVMAHIPAHGTAAARYERAMRERNALLERGHVDPAWADAIETRMAEAGTEIAINRATVLDSLQAAVNARPEGYFPKGDLSLQGEAEAAAAAGDDFKTIFERLSETYRTGRRRDMAAGRTLTGPHRTDLAVIHRPTGMPAADASTGQQKALLIGLILASAAALAENGDGPSPILLLDEAAAHLDADRRAALFDELTALGGQAWLTGTESFLFEAFGDRAQRFDIRDGEAIAG